MTRKWLSLAAAGGSLAACLGQGVACGGRANLGSNAPPADNPALAGDPLAAGSVLYSFDGEWKSYGSLAVDGDYLYLWTTHSNLIWDPGATFGLQRCSKDDCATLRAIAGPLGGDSGRQRLAGAHLTFTVHESYATSLRMCSTPNCDDLHDVIAGLPDASGVTFDSDGVYWGLSADHAIYECRLPACAGGARVVASGPGNIYMGDIATDADSIYWITDTLIWRVDKHGAGKPEALEPGPSLRKVEMDGGGVPTDFGLPTSSDPGTKLVGLTVDGAWLYALEFDAPSCSASTCPTSVVRWPSHGYEERQTVLVSSNLIGAFTVFQGEMVWREASPSDFPYAPLYSCRADSCPESKRWLSRQAAIFSGDESQLMSFQASSGFIPMAAADDTYLYWIGADSSNDVSSFLSRFKEVRRVQRLPP